jgi:hypothetical protein
MASSKTSPTETIATATSGSGYVPPRVWGEPPKFRDDHDGVPRNALLHMMASHEASQRAKLQCGGTAQVLFEARPPAPRGIREPLRFAQLSLTLAHEPDVQFINSTMGTSPMYRIRLIAP